MTGYNGHKNWNHWNVSLWLSNDEALYRMAKHHLKFSKTKDDAARAVFEDLKAAQHSATPQTPDGAAYSVTTIRAALRGF